MKTAISLPTGLFEAAERLSRRLGMSRSQLYATAVAEYLKGHVTEGITEALDKVYSGEPSASVLDPAIQQLQSRSIPKERW